MQRIVYVYFYIFTFLVLQQKYLILYYWQVKEVCLYFFFNLKITVYSKQNFLIWQNYLEFSYIGKSEFSCEVDHL